jgi:poly-gamma-glutamate synthesis protein (capsule biosynthesis protein)
VTYKLAAASQIIWESPDEWWVPDFFLGDADNDSILELNLLVWKSGSFGPHKPFWITREDMSIKNHLFIFKLAGGAFKPVWQSSNLDRPNYQAALADLNGDGKNELIVTEGDYADPGVREVGVWQWNGWGFSKISYGEPQE